jgi:endonuclease III
VGLKTAHYLRILVGLPDVAVDVHLRRFVQRAGIGARDDREVHDLVAHTAELMGADPAALDHSIWVYMSGTK